MNPRIVVALFLVGAFALGAVVLAAGGGDDDETSPNTFEGSLMPEGLRAPNFRLRNQDGDPVSMRSLRGQPVVVTFLYTTCEDTCPIQAQTIRGALDELGHDVPALAIAVDPPRDTPERAQAFLAKQRATGRIDFVLGSRAELRPVWKGFGNIQPAVRDPGAPSALHARRLSGLPTHRLSRSRGDARAAGARPAPARARGFSD